MNNRALFTICALCLLIGGLIGAIAMAIARPSVPAAVASQLERGEDQLGPVLDKVVERSPPRFQQAAEQGGKPELTNDTGPYPGSVLVTDDKVLPREAKVIRDLLKKETYNGTWVEIEWRRDLPGRGNERVSILGMGEDDYGISLTYKSIAPAGVLVKHDIHAVFYDDGSIKITGGPLRNLKVVTIPRPTQ